MRRIALFGFLSLLLAATAAAQTGTYFAVMVGAQENPPADPDGIGFAVVTLDAAAGTATFALTGFNIATPNASHIHRGQPGVNGAVVLPFNLAFTNGVSTGVTMGVAPALINEIMANPENFYANVHNADFPGGAIRGQLRAAPGTNAPTILHLPVSVKATGARGENFVEDVRIVNPNATAINVTIDFFTSSSTALAGPTATKVVAVPAGSQLVLNDILGQTFNTSGTGALRFTSDRFFVAEGRIANDKRAVGQGTLGFFIHGLRIEENALFKSGVLPVLSQASAAQVSSGVGYRTNIGYFNPNLAAVNVTFTARKTSDGSSLGSVTVNVPAFSQSQFAVFDLINTVAAGDRTQDDFYVSYTVSGGTLFVYMAVADNFTGDSYYSAGVVSP